MLRGCTVSCDGQLSFERGYVYFPYPVTISGRPATLNGRASFEVLFTGGDMVFFENLAFDGAWEVGFKRMDPWSVEYDLPWDRVFSSLYYQLLNALMATAIISVGIWLVLRKYGGAMIRRMRAVLRAMREQLMLRWGEEKALT